MTGRPTLYREDFCAKVIELGKTGCCLAEIAAHLGVSRDTVYEWIKQHPSFSDAITRARELSLAWWSEQGRKGVWGGSEFNANAFKFMATNRFPDEFKDKREHNVTVRTLEDILQDSGADQ